MRRFESDYRINEGDDVLAKENAIHQDVDLRLDAIEALGQAFAEGNRADIDAILKSLEATFSGLAAEMRSLLDQTAGGLSADIITETATRTFLTPARRATILADLRGGVDGAGDTLAKLYAVALARATPADLATATAAVVDGAPSDRNTLRKLSDALNALTAGADPLIDTFAEVASKFTAQGSALTEVMAAIGNRVRGDAAMNAARSFRAQARRNILNTVLGITSNYSPTVDDEGALLVFSGGAWTINLPALAAADNGFELHLRNADSYFAVSMTNGTVDGVSGLILCAKQDCTLRWDGTAWRTIGLRNEWVVGSFVQTNAANLVVDVPQAVKRMVFELQQASTGGNGRGINVLLSADGSTYFTGANHYIYEFLYSASSTGFAATGQITGSSLSWTPNVNGGQNQKITGTIDLIPGDTVINSPQLMFRSIGYSPGLSKQQTISGQGICYPNSYFRARKINFVDSALDGTLWSGSLVAKAMI